ncbi:MAG: response regulator [Bacteroidales bacterium]|nr:response regulator [Bacteroidales bacterium]
MQENEIKEKKYTISESKDFKPIILIVDDNIEILNYIVDTFAHQYIIETALDGEEGLAKARRIIPNLIITDLMMPKMNGMELCTALKADAFTNHIPILVLSAKNEFEVQLKSIEVGAFDFIPKPFNKEMLFLKVRTLLKAQEKYKNYLKDQLEKTPLTVSHKPEDTFMLAIHKILEENYKNYEFNVEQFAWEMNCSRSQLFRKMKAITDTSPVEYIKVYRLKRAMEFIENGFDRVSELAYNVGFNDPMYFSNCFKAYYGVTPNVLIKEKKNS